MHFFSKIAFFRAVFRKFTLFFQQTHCFSKLFSEKQPEKFSKIAKTLIFVNSANRRSFRIILVETAAKTIPDTILIPDTDAKSEPI